MGGRGQGCLWKGGMGGRQEGGMCVERGQFQYDNSVTCK